MQPQRYGPFPYRPIIDRAPWKWPNGKRVAVWVIPNIEFYPLNIGYHMSLPGVPALQPNIMEWSRRDYGNRVGVFRMMDVLASRKVRATVALNSDICLEHPRIIERCNELEWELMGHGETNMTLMTLLEPDVEKGVISRTLSVIEKVSGTRPKGWLGPGLTESWHTLDFLAAEGVRYVADFVNDDQPYQMDVGNPKLISIPYTSELNDTQQMNRRALSADAFGDLIKTSFDQLYEEGEKSARVMAIALHPWIAGHPHAARALGKTLDYIGGHDGAWFATGKEIIEAYLEAAPKETAKK